jgi:hypothetical protein
MPVADHLAVAGRLMIAARVIRIVLFGDITGSISTVGVTCEFNFHVSAFWAAFCTLLLRAMLELNPVFSLLKSHWGPFISLKGYLLEVHLGRRKTLVYLQLKMGLP